MAHVSDDESRLRRSLSVKDLFSDLRHHFSSDTDRYRKRIVNGAHLTACTSNTGLHAEGFLAQQGIQERRRFVI
jgi:hypothetical protein